MEVYIGGKGQKKVLYTGLKQELIMEGSTISMEEIFTAYAVNHFHCFVQRYRKDFQEEEHMKDFVEKLVEENPKVIIIGDEIGYGLVPLSKEEREYREIYGRMMCLISQKARKVTRIICGICQVIKDERE
ncbi:MAG: bifunctional adenosylcobinamide kinase/adenosylcobinamide-phosphate guanylyltransferase [Thermoflexaceae bacterium]|nr:bifunctional adenosylcobinamide kinase/adenosylcobinamide-phosphate guanylyltransferase [Thermoflexaceae bacterium]